MFCKGKIFILGLICTSLLLLTSCGIKNKNTRIDLKNKISYVEASPHVTIDKIKKFDSTFKQLPLNKYNNLFSLLKDKNNYILRFYYNQQCVFKYHTIFLFKNHYSFMNKK
jgi:hypothetical protein